MTLCGFAIFLQSCDVLRSPFERYSGQGKSAEVSAPESLPIGVTEKALCSSIGNASSGGLESLFAPLVVSSEGSSYVRSRATHILRWQSHGFAGSEMHGGRCWAVGVAQGVTPAGIVDYRWTCPAALVSDDLSSVGHTTLEQVDDKECAFGAGQASLSGINASGALERIPL